MTNLYKAIAAASVCLGVAACAGPGPGPDTVTSTAPGTAPSGITSSNGGGQRQTGNIPSVTVGGGRAGMTGVPNTTGNAY